MAVAQSTRNAPLLRNLSSTTRRRLLVVVYFIAIVSVLGLFGVLTGGRPSISISPLMQETSELLHIWLPVATRLRQDMTVSGRLQPRTSFEKAATL